MQFVATFIALVILGILDAGYLFIQHRQKKPLVCPFDHDCSVVTESKWGNIIGIRNEFIGLIFYILALGAILTSLVLPHFAGLIYALLFIAVSIALLFSLVLVYIQFYAIRDYCFYCLISAAINVLLFANSLYLLKTFG